MKLLPYSKLTNKEILYIEQGLNQLLKNTINEYRKNIVIVQDKEEYNFFILKEQKAIKRVLYHLDKAKKSRRTVIQYDDTYYIKCGINMVKWLNYDKPKELKQIEKLQEKLQ